MRRLGRLGAGLIAIVVLAGCGSSSVEKTVALNTPVRTYTCLQRIGEHPVKLSAASTADRYFGQVNGAVPLAVYRLKGELVLGVFRTVAQARQAVTVFMPEGATMSVSDNNVVTDFMGHQHQRRYLAEQSTLARCYARPPGD